MRYYVVSLSVLLAASCAAPEEVSSPSVQVQAEGLLASLDELTGLEQAAAEALPEGPERNTFSMIIHAQRMIMVVRIQQALQKLELGEVSESEAAKQMRTAVRSGIENWVSRLMHPAVDAREMWEELIPRLEEINSHMDTLSRAGD